MKFLIYLMAQIVWLSSGLALGSFFPDSALPKSRSSLTGQGVGTAPHPAFFQKTARKLQVLTQSDFNARIDEVENYYSPVYAALGVKLDLQRDWDNPSVNASASKNDKNWIIQVFGGLAREVSITPDSFTLVLCHEIGHHLGGFPFKNETTASEGQADYYATQVCLRNLWKNSTHEKTLQGLSIDTTAKKKCLSQWNSQPERDLCYRISAASIELSTLLSNLADGKPVSFLTPELKEVESTNKFHPTAQCRLDTFLSGSLCQTAFDELFIPGFAPSLGEEEKEKEALRPTLSRCLL